ncbi:hypothetical protein PQR62_16125 [Herbaspirillum lusitanum]|uniref:DUF4136 domain-containing protein n=1 Tax=Herbaspirillum lusitanum TaxID=213312 RepID=A0ABW9ABH9_9BURK
MKWIAVMLAALLASANVSAELLEGSVFQPNGENLIIQTPPNWRMAYMNGDPGSDYVVEFLPPNEAHDSWREGYMSVQRRTLPGSALMDGIRARQLTLSSVAVGEVLQNVQRNCAGKFMQMRQKDTLTGSAPTSISGGFCDRYGAAAPYGEGSVFAVVEGKKSLFVVQFGWRPATQDENKQFGYRISPERLQVYLDLLNRAVLCGADDEPACPK